MESSHEVSRKRMALRIEDVYGDRVRFPHQSICPRCKRRDEHALIDCCEYDPRLPDTLPLVNPTKFVSVKNAAHSKLKAVIRRRRARTDD